MKLIFLFGAIVMSMCVVQSNATFLNENELARFCRFHPFLCAIFAPQTTTPAAGGGATTIAGATTAAPAAAETTAASAAAATTAAPVPTTPAPAP